MTEEQAIQLSKDILHDNKMLYCMHKKPMTETCMCWGLEVPDSWLNEIDELSKKLEGMNAMVYQTHRVRIQADQVKIKFGTLRFYYTSVIDPPSFVKAYENAIDWIMSKIGRLDFKSKTVVDKEEYDEVIEEVIPPDRVEADKDLYSHVSNVDIIEQEDGKFIKKTTYHHYKQTHLEPTKHRLLHKIWKRRYIVRNFLRNLLRWKPSYSQKCVAEVLDSYAFKAVLETEEKCMHICEHCGKHIGDDWSPACITHGWVSYVCEDCAVKDGAVYSKDGKLWREGKLYVEKTTSSNSEEDNNIEEDNED